MNALDALMAATQLASLQPSLLPHRGWHSRGSAVLRSRRYIRHRAAFANHFSRVDGSCCTVACATNTAAAQPQPIPIKHATIVDTLVSVPLFSHSRLAGVR